MMGEGNRFASVILFTFTLKLGPNAHSSSCGWLMSCVDNSLPLIPTPPLIMAVNIGAAECRPLPSEPPWPQLAMDP